MPKWWIRLVINLKHRKMQQMPMIYKNTWIKSKISKRPINSNTYKCVAILITRRWSTRSQQPRSSQIFPGHSMIRVNHFIIWRSCSKASFRLNRWDRYKYKKANSGPKTAQGVSRWPRICTGKERSQVWSWRETKRQKPRSSKNSSTATKRGSRTRQARRRKTRTTRRRSRWVWGISRPNRLRLIYRSLI